MKILVLQIEDILIVTRFLTRHQGAIFNIQSISAPLVLMATNL